MNAINALNTDSYTHRKWAARLELHLRRHGERTVLAHSQHLGPLRVQRPFFPEGLRIPHLYLLHPPGGMAPGDSLNILVRCEAGAETLITTPSANRIYSTDAFDHEQSQITELNIDRGGCVEWLPQETLVFNNANANLHLRINAKAEGRFFAWEILVLGRTGSDAPFERGSCHQRIEINLDGLPLLCENTHLTGGSDLMTAAWGLDHATVTGVWVCQGIPAEDARTIMEQLRTEMAKQMTDLTGVRLGFTRKDSLLIGRIIGNDSEQVRNLFIHCWKILRPALKGQPATLPRIWAT